MWLKNRDRKCVFVYESKTKIENKWVCVWLKNRDRKCVFVYGSKTEIENVCVKLVS